MKWLLAISIVMLPAVASADMGPRLNRWFYPVGINIGMDDRDGDGSLLLGVEGSAAYVTEEAFWYGGFAEVSAVRDGPRLRGALGAEAGWLIFGADAGYLIERADGSTRHALRVRGMLAFAVGSVYVGYSARPGAANSVEAGLLLKYPIGLNP